MAHDYLVVIDDDHDAAFHAWLARYQLELVQLDSKGTPLFGIRQTMRRPLTGVGNPDNERVLDPLRDQRISAGVSVSRAAYVIGLGPQALNAIEHGRAEISETQRRALEVFYEAVASGEITS